MSLEKLIYSDEMYLKRPFLKIKLNFCNKTLRLVVIRDLDNDLFIPVFVTDKNDYKYGYNMTWELIKNKILNIMKKINIDIENDNYRIL